MGIASSSPTIQPLVPPPLTPLLLVFADLDTLRRRKSRSDPNGPLSDSASSTDAFPLDDVGAPSDARDRIESAVDDAQGTTNLAGDNGGDTEIRETGGGRGGSDPRGEVDTRYMYRPSVPAHRWVRESPLGSDAIFKQSHAGLFNLCVVFLIAVNSRLIIENLMKVRSLRMNGSCAPSMKSVSVVHGIVIFREAGELIFDPSGKDLAITSRRIAVSNVSLKELFVAPS
ncbi:unnamed protein product [Thlaspi arvense]|uniref:Uncharacterized protein n=1 Tax=Thlaspi arvense TaxID=13288 RepID=A0AAU9STU1_THLAR|nr:unnamed protein product [Thlaspi arvense]